ncbi:amino acid ABC transporter ATP-binding protein (PAAT family) [Hypnocyclicus thermotrophus]|uniref:Amino acid ABC transporter ATP-binding protein (PAAT family) n=1 Tax=Hypnocyclicus thermotrophus TaxID=1627895 RepID=A0AA46DY65_9FUSO|nr:amino acid ABC transporter ATP-binding protein [Hypnocyclicus thermotrophus]TDT69234.1 amino acid ABC transporter ATP-binding protein (PAAT family) [Hypnocyclicus thermotrophus]
MNLTIKNLKKDYDKPVLKGINLELKNKNIIGVIGPSGGGKSTFLRLVAGLEELTEGSIIVNGLEITKDKIKDYHKKIGFVFQSHSLFPHLTILRNITLILEKIHKINKKNAEEKTIYLLEKFGLLEHMHKLPEQLSGGQSQRASIVRSLAINPDILFFDEPTSSLDPILTYEVLETILKLKDEKKDFIIVTHEIGFARDVADYILFIDEGKIIEHGPPNILSSPKTKNLKIFLSKVLSWNKN